jgi:hypothetical protein
LRLGVALHEPEVAEPRFGDSVAGAVEHWSGQVEAGDGAAVAGGGRSGNGRGSAAAADVEH